MSVYPIKMRTISLDHRGGTKSYHLMMIEAANGNCVVVNRWGKTGVFGEMKVETFDSPVKAQKAWDKKEREKTGKGYSQTGSTREAIASEQSELSRTIGLSTFNKMGASAVKHLDPSFDTTGMREADPAQYDEETGAKIDTSRKADLSNLIQEQKQREAENAARAYAENDLYGRF
jgi:predicted DNA-binding WGR domain protein